MTQSAPSRTISDARLFAAVLLAALVLASATASHNENRTIDLVRALAAGRLSIDADASNTGDRALVDGHYYSGGAPGLAFALLPAGVFLVRVLAGNALVFALTFLGAGVPLALGTLGVRRAASAMGAPPERAALVALAHAFGTIALPFATRLYSHSLVVCLVAWSLALLLERRRLLLAGRLAAAAVACDYNVALVAAALLAFAVLRERQGAAWFVLGALPPALLLGLYQRACFGSFFATPYDFHADHYTRELIKSGYGFSWPRPRIVFALLFGTRRGFLATQPVALAGLFGLALLARSDRRALYALLVSAAVILANAARTYDWFAGASFGPRYSAAALPFLALGYGAVFERLGRASAAVLAPSFALALLGATTDWGYDVHASFTSAWVAGPRVGSLAAALGDAPLAVSVGSLVALALLLPLVYATLRGAEGGPVFALGLVGALAGAPGALHAFFAGPDAVRAALEDGRRDQFKRSVAEAGDAREAREYVAQIVRSGDRELLTIALHRVLDFEPEDPIAKQLLEKLAAGDGARREDVKEEEPPKAPDPPK